MPIYNVTDTTTGRSLELKGDSPPTEQELIRIFAAQPPQQENPIDRIFRQGEERRQKQAEEAANAPSMLGSFPRGAREAAAPYWIAGVGVLSVVVLVVLWKFLRSRPLRIIPRAMRTAAKMKDKMMFDLSDQDAEWFAAAEEELTSGKIDKATWARALVKAGGNEEKRKVDYITLRVKKMRLGE
jgi:hypothetical protein